MYDVIIIGGGPAGLTASVYTARKKLNTLVLTKDFGGQPMWTTEIENYMGYQFITGPELMEKFDEQARHHSDNIKYEEARKLTINTDNTFTVATGNGQYQAKAVIIASGKRPRRMEVPGEVEFTGRGVSYCATCDGPLFANKTVAVVGGGNSAVQAAYELSGVAETVYLIVRNRYSADPVMLDKLQQAKNVIALQGYISKEVQGNLFVEKFIVARKDRGEETDLAVQGIFVEIGLNPNTEFAEGVIALNQRREIMVDCRCRTNVSGLFAAGDVTDGIDKQIVIAAGDGAKAALIAYEYLLHR
ncbi:FAD-dependent oxidoreductase|uniref:Alkyl hydroperoxide reductase subunit F n=1 Tax=Dendrosporobacter quercicolus TaxID=146817 RepID=A0A1G9RNQ2_9FIRM|nr:FAD-dependent oxidoreductase [Dendrosporobacter quercicolus]NSL49391.1 FAD-dependent oxidoreductase [Dendrosporobacter quercicolus DSM 1736]SDM24918.1 alkyl hydroperoxide reductase subunit F [Dendrosporobacter quercicolus]